MLLSPPSCGELKLGPWSQVFWLQRLPCHRSVVLVFPVLPSSQSPLLDLTLLLRCKVYVQGGWYSILTLPDTPKQITSISCKILGPEVRPPFPLQLNNLLIGGGSSAPHSGADDRSPSLGPAPHLFVKPDKRYLVFIREDESDMSSPFSHLGRCCTSVLPWGGMSQVCLPLSVLSWSPSRAYGALNKMSPISLWHLNSGPPVGGYLERIRFGLVRGDVSLSHKVGMGFEVSKAPGSPSVLCLPLCRARVEFSAVPSARPLLLHFGS